MNRPTPPIFKCSKRENRNKLRMNVNCIRFNQLADILDCTLNFEFPIILVSLRRLRVKYKYEVACNPRPWAHAKHLLSSKTACFVPRLPLFPRLICTYPILFVTSLKESGENKAQNCLQVLLPPAEVCSEVRQTKPNRIPGRSFRHAGPFPNTGGLCSCFKHMTVHRAPGRPSPE